MRQQDGDLIPFCVGCDYVGFAIAVQVADGYAFRFLACGTEAGCPALFLTTVILSPPRRASE